MKVYIHTDIEGVRRGIARRKEIPPFVIPGPPYTVAASDRDPGVLISEAMEGEDFFRLVHDYLNTFPWNAISSRLSPWLSPWESCQRS